MKRVRREQRDEDVEVEADRRNDRHHGQDESELGVAPGELAEYEFPRANEGLLALLANGGNVG